MWVLEYWDDIDADFLRFYGIDLTKVDSVEPPRFFKLAYRLPAYEGVLSSRIQEEKDLEAKRNPTAKALKKNPDAKVVDFSEMVSDSEESFIEYK